MIRVQKWNLSRRICLSYCPFIELQEGIGEGRDGCFLALSRALTLLPSAVEPSFKQY